MDIYGQVFCNQEYNNNDETAITIITNAIEI